MKKIIKKYTNKYNDLIQMIVIDRETEASVFFKSGSNARKITGGGRDGLFMGTIYADTPKEVYEFMKSHHDLRISQLRTRLDHQINRAKELEKYWQYYLAGN